ncbi:sulfated surface glycoprotein 185-like isoform X2 [Ischnura elegans]|uniref:sulfated surface glycoprotein 185-like isoform X2 n=1 Tax=Ischnura elegans TaxID=197161 RepID=UPI001ED88A22|nr:sulfated surface glycoprotein 185-like isoform X2 [Ischnura elegans]
MGYSGFRYCFAVVSTVLFLCSFLPNECNGVMESCPSLESLRRCQLDSDCLQGGKCAEMNGTLGVCLASPHLRGAEGGRNGSSLERGRCVQDEDCGQSSRIKCCHFPPHSYDGLCIDVLLPASDRRRTKGCATNPSGRPLPFNVGLPSLPHSTSLPPPTASSIPPTPTSNSSPPPPSTPVAPYPSHFQHLYVTPPGPPRRYRPLIPQPTPSTQPLTEVMCPPNISAAFLRIECQTDAHCGNSGEAKCCPTTAGKKMCVQIISIPTSSNKSKPGYCPHNAGPWECRITCTSDRGCPGSSKCCSGRCPGSRLCLDNVI